MWDPKQYQIYADQRRRPFEDLMARVRAEHVDEVADLGCGPGDLTLDLARCWPGARVVGVDSSPEMIRRAREHDGDAGFVLADLREWTPERPLDVLVSNATLQWVPRHLDLLPRLASFLGPDAWLAFQLPANAVEPAHAELRDLAASARWVSRVDVTWPAARAPVEYLDVLLDLRFVAEVWETTYAHVLDGPDAILEWMRGSVLRPVLAQLDDTESEEFVEQYRHRLRRTYPVGRHGTVLRYRRIFVVGRREAE